jgi:hypothetical protein
MAAAAVTRGYVSFASGEEPTNSEMVAERRPTHRNPLTENKMRNATFESK